MAKVLEQNQCSPTLVNSLRMKYSLYFYINVHISKMKIDSKIFAKNVYKLVNQIPYGRVMTYGQIAAVLGLPRCAQYVGWALHWADQEKVPYQRVLNRFGGLAGGYPDGGRDRHRIDLAEEGISP